MFWGEERSAIPKAPLKPFLGSVFDQFGGKSAVILAVASRLGSLEEQLRFALD